MSSINSEITISKLEEEQIPNVIRIVEEQLGEGYLSANDFKDKQNISITASVSEKVVGICIGKIIPVSDLNKKFPQIADCYLEHYSDSDMIGIVSTIAVDAAIAKQGIGTRLFSSCINTLESLGVDFLMSIGWKSKQGVQIRSLAMKNGFKELCEIHKFWYEDSQKQNYKCPSCGNPPCECSAVLFGKENK